ncbi:MAG: hypothetical protein M3121_00395 [Chloroflexota bacterium]|nr:hypothetical protein [Chloroflexota bacterium]
MAPMGLITLILLLLYLLLFGVDTITGEPVTTHSGNVTVQSAAWRVVAGDGYLGVVVPEADAPVFVREAGWNPAAAYWTPSPEEIAALEAEIDDTWTANAPRHARDEDLSGHLRQYVGTVEAGEHLILVNAFCDPYDADWQSEPVVVADGGACYFQATWDVERAEFRSLTVNGEA